jgi:hypothetical protein
MNQHIIRGRRLAEPRTPIELPTRPAWMFHPDRPCAGGDLWTSNDRAELSAAAKLCRKRQCPVLQECGRWAVDNGEKHHVWGGMNFSTAEMHAVVEQAKAQVPGPVKSKQVRELWKQGLSDSTIALRLDKTPGAINHIRQRLGLATLYGPGGKPKRRTAA